MLLAWQEAQELLTLVEREIQFRSLSGSELKRLINQIRYDNAFGRMLSHEEEEELRENPYQVLIDV